MLPNRLWLHPVLLKRNLLLLWRSSLRVFLLWDVLLRLGALLLQRGVLRV